MSDPADRPLLADIRAELGLLGDELREMAVARWELARLELQSDMRSALRLVVVWLAAGIMALTSLPLLAVCLAEALDGYGNIDDAGWLLIFAGGLLIAALAGGFFAWRCFRRRFVGLQETLEELHEDLVWMQEKAEGGRGKGED